MDKEDKKDKKTSKKDYIQKLIILDRQLDLMLKMSFMEESIKQSIRK
jgi:hypothetical protein